MLDAITAQFPQATRDTAERSIAASAGVLFAVVVCGTAALLTGRIPFSLDPAMMTLYASVIPLSVAGFMTQFSKKAPRLPMLATLWFLALFIPGMFLSEWFSHGQELHIGGLELASHNFVGFRAIVVAVLSGLVFTGVRADGSVGAELAREFEGTSQADSKVDWGRRHDEAVRRLAVVDVDLRRQRTTEQDALDAFDRLLASEPMNTTPQEWSLDLEDDECELDIEVTSQVAA